ncbi:MAG: nitrite reductase small subunit [Gammaproteobacteria bacterium]|nr:nitrite reductase small subunit [Gammaproteobacteria bacterium]
MQVLEAVNVNLVTGAWVKVGAVEDIVDGVGVCALIGGQQVAVFRLPGGGQYYAIDNHDPFSEANVLSRGLVGNIKGQPVVASPIYKQHFNLQTGQCLEDESVRLETFAVRVKEGIVQIESK